MSTAKAEETGTEVPKVQKPDETVTGGAQLGTVPEESFVKGTPGSELKIPNIIKIKKLTKPVSSLEVNSAPEPEFSTSTTQPELKGKGKSPPSYEN
jgi:hypothetical protein